MQRLLIGKWTVARHMRVKRPESFGTIYIRVVNAEASGSFAR